MNANLYVSWVFANDVVVLCNRALQSTALPQTPSTHEVGLRLCCFTTLLWLDIYKQICNTKSDCPRMGIIERVAGLDGIYS